MIPESPSYLRKESPSFRDKSALPYLGLIFPYQELILPYQRLFIREVWELETRKFVDKYPWRISRLYLSIANLPYMEGWSSGGFKTLLAFEEPP